MTAPLPLFWKADLHISGEETMYQYEKPEKKLLGEQIEDELMRYIL